MLTARPQYPSVNTSFSNHYIFLTADAADAERYQDSHFLPKDEPDPLEHLYDLAPLEQQQNPFQGIHLDVLRHPSPSPPPSQQVQTLSEFLNQKTPPVTKNGKTLRKILKESSSPLKPAELKVLRDQYEKEGEYVGIQTKFNYAWVIARTQRPFTFQVVKLTTMQGLIRSNLRADQQEGVRLLSEIFKAASERRRECLYYLALGNYKLGNYAEAKRCNDALLEKEPGNLQAASLKQLIDDKVQKEGLVGVAIVGGIAVAAGVVGSLLFRGAQRKR